MNSNKNLLGNDLAPCRDSHESTGYTRNNYCEHHPLDTGKHYVCAVMDKAFLDYTGRQGNPLRSVVSEGENWCLCESRWKQANDRGVAPRVLQNATNSLTSNDITSQITKHRKH
jgi:uncharacterized protein (DUF2237 family)